MAGRKLNTHLKEQHENLEGIKKRVARVLNVGGRGQNKPLAQTNVNSLKFPLAPMGVLAPGSAHARPSARPPIDTSGNFSAHMSGGGKLSDSFSDQLSRQIREF